MKPRAVQQSENFDLCLVYSGIRILSATASISQSHRRYLNLRDALTSEFPSLLLRDFVKFDGLKMVARLWTPAKWQRRRKN
jgi:hypothetical protein